MDSNRKTGVAIALGLAFAVVGCLGFGLIAAGLSYFAEQPDRGPTTLGGPVAFFGDAGVEHGGPSEADFAQHLEAALADAGHPGYAYQPDDSTMRADGGAVMSLTNLYGEYQRTPPDERDAFVGRVVRGLFPAELPQRYEDARAALLPSVRDAVYLDLLDVRTPDNHVVRRAVSQELSAVLAWDGEDSMQFVSTEQLEDWGVDVDTAWQDALDNLERRSQGRFEQVTPGVYRSPWKDNYDTARVLLPQRLARLKVKGAPVVFLPHRDALIVTGADDDDGLLAALDAVDEALELPRATTGRAWRVDGTALEPFLPAEGSPAHEALKEYAEDARVMDANDQKAALDERYEADGVDLFVATLFRVESKSTGERFTYCVLTKTVDSLLPKADWVVFVDLDRPKERQLVGVAPWAQFVKLLGKAVQPAKVPGPQRFRVRGFPTPAQQKTLKADLP